MGRFPRSESEIAALALRVVEGLGNAAEEYPNPPVSPAELKEKLDAFNAADTGVVAAKTAYLEQHATKDDALEDLVDGLKADLKYAEVAVREDPEKLNALGWRAARRGAALKPPGETRDITIVSEGDTWVILRWNPPIGGGAVAVYQVERKREGDPWADVAMSTVTEALLSNQPRGVEFTYRVYAVNKAGIGQPSGIVTVVL
jgi:Fibronectin type III domain